MIDTNDTTPSMRPCPSTPNCVSSLDKDPRHFVAPLRYSGSVREAQQKLLWVLNSMRRVRIVTVKADYIHAESISPIMRFVDDMEFFFSKHHRMIHIKSASRVGYSDLGVNRRRVEKIRRRFNARSAERR
jgi:uncharacterized protein (DUF1499 family)